MTSRVLAAMLLLASACGDDVGSRFPINPGGGGGGGSLFPDAGTDPVDASTTIAGRVCLLGDPRSLTSCAAVAEGFTVTLGDKTATTTGNGAFVIDRPAGSNLVWRVSGTGIESSALPLVSSTTIPVVNSLTYDDMLAATNAVVTFGTGALIARVASGTTPVEGIVAVPTPLSDSEVYYDGASVTEWEVDETGAGGIVWIPSLVTGSASLALDSGTDQSTVSSIPIFTDTITFVYAAAP